MSHPALEVERDGATLTLWLNDPDARNAQTPSLWGALAAAAEQIPDDVRVVLLRGRGDSFSAGLHRGMLDPAGMPGEANFVRAAATDPASLPDAIAEFQRAFTLWRELPQVVVAVVQGHAIGAGFQLALGADLRVCADDVSFAMKEVRLGLVPDLAGTTPLTRLVGPGRALELCATGRAVLADEALRLGIANLVVPRADLDASVEALVADLLGTPATALAEVKGLFRTAGVVDAAEQERLEREAQARALSALVAPFASVLAQQEPGGAQA